MHILRDTPTLVALPGEDIWDRLKSDAPGPPRHRVPLFRRQIGPKSHRREEPLAVYRQNGLVPDENEAAAIGWQSLATAPPEQQNTSLLRWLGAGSGQPQVDTQTFDLLRTRLLQVLRANGLVSMAVTAPSPSCGTTFTATNLALSLARLTACKTVLVDLNFRSPGVAGALGLTPAPRLRPALLGKAPLADSLVRYSSNLVLGLAGAPDPAPAELFLDPRVMRRLQDIKEALRPDVIIYDLPPMLAYDDATALLPGIDGVLLVADGTRTVADEMKRCEDILANQTRLLGIVLNRARGGIESKLRYA